MRYCDDFLLLADDADRLREATHSLSGWLAARRLCLHTDRLAVQPSRSGRVFVGFRTWHSHRLLKAANVRAFLRRFRWLRRAYARWQVSTREICPRLQSWLGHAGQANTFHLVRRLSRAWVFQRTPRPRSS